MIENDSMNQFAWADSLDTHRLVLGDMAKKEAGISSGIPPPQPFTEEFLGKWGPLTTSHLHIYNHDNLVDTPVITARAYQFLSTRLQVLREIKQNPIWQLPWGYFFPEASLLASETRLAATTGAPRNTYFIYVGRKR